MSAAVDEHVVYRIANAPRREYPYPLCYLGFVLPDEFQRAGRKYWPDGASLVSLADSGRVTPGAYPDRFILPFTPKKIEKLSKEKRDFWHDFGSWFLGERFLQALLRKFSSGLQRRFGDALDRQPLDRKSVV